MLEKKVNKIADETRPYIHNSIDMIFEHVSHIHDNPNIVADS